jgi:hypothetical protein
MVLWQRILVTLLAILATSIIFGLLWSSLFNTRFPSYIGGVIGGLTAVPVWEVVKRIGSKPKD